TGFGRHPRVIRAARSLEPGDRFARPKDPQDSPDFGSATAHPSPVLPGTILTSATRDLASTWRTIFGSPGGLVHARGLFVWLHSGAGPGCVRRRLVCGSDNGNAAGIAVVRSGAQAARRGGPGSGRPARRPAAAGDECAGPGAAVHRSRR